jgi:hypothetical protein
VAAIDAAMELLGRLLRQGSADAVRPHARIARPALARPASPLPALARPSSHTCESAASLERWTRARFGPPPLPHARLQSKVQRHAPTLKQARNMRRERSGSNP